MCPNYWSQGPLIYLFSSTLKWFYFVDVYSGHHLLKMIFFLRTVYLERNCCHIFKISWNSSLQDGHFHENLCKGNVFTMFACDRNLVAGLTSKHATIDKIAPYSLVPFHHSFTTGPEPRKNRSYKITIFFLKLYGGMLGWSNLGERTKELTIDDRGRARAKLPKDDLWLTQLEEK